jgi:hypothetical protein
MLEHRVSCEPCAGTGWATFGDRHTQTNKDTCGRCAGTGMAPALTGETPKAAYQPDGSTPQGVYPSTGQVVDLSARRQAAEEAAELNVYEIGQIICCAEEGGGPDIGWSIGLGNGLALYVGEISDALHAEAGEAAAALGGSGGTWIALYDRDGPPDRQIRLLGKALDGRIDEELFLVLAAGLRRRA